MFGWREGGSSDFYLGTDRCPSSDFEVQNLMASSNFDLVRSSQDPNLRGVVGSTSLDVSFKYSGKLRRIWRHGHECAYHDECSYVACRMIGASAQHGFGYPEFNHTQPPIYFAPYLSGRVFSLRSFRIACMKCTL